MTPIKISKIIKKIKYNFTNATSLFSTSENLFFINKSGDIFTINEKNGELKLEKKNFAKNIECFCSNTTHFYFIQKNSRILYRASILKNQEQEETIKINSSSNLEIIKKNFSDFKIDEKENNKKEEKINFINFKNSEQQKIHTNLIEEIKFEDLIFNISTKDTEKDKKIKILTKPENFHSDIFPISLNQRKAEEINSGTVSQEQRKRSCSLSTEYLKTQKFHEFEENINPLKLICDEKKLVIIDKTGELNILNIENKTSKNFQCLFMLRNCHLSNSVLIGDGDLILLDPVRLSLNKLNIISGTEIIILHSVKFLSSIKYLFTNNSKIYLIDIQGNLFYFNEFDKKIIQIGINGLCKYIIDFSVHKNYLFTIENNTALYRTNLADGIYKEFKNDYVKNYLHFLSNNSVIVFIYKDDYISIIIPGDELVLKKKFKHENISKYKPVTLFKKNIIYYNNDKKTIECIDIGEDEIKTKVLVENFGEVQTFINNNDCLACILKDCVIYKLYC